MGYSSKELADLAGVSTRTLRFYEQKGLLRPKRQASNGYRDYGAAEVDRLQEILFYRQIGFTLNDIKALLDSGAYCREEDLMKHLSRLSQEKQRIEKLIQNVQKTIRSISGEERMTDVEKFEGLKDKLVRENEEKYGEEVREKYGDEVVDASNKKVKGMTQAEYDRAQALSVEVNQAIRAAMETSDPSGEKAQHACELHKQWLLLYWPKGYYSKEAHMGLGQMYVDDERFAAYYDKIKPGAAVFLNEALKCYCK